MPDQKVYDQSLEMLDELEENLAEEYPDTMEALAGARSALETEFGGMGEEGEGEDFPAELEGDVEEEEEGAVPADGPMGELPPGLEDEEEEEEAPMPF